MYKIAIFVLTSLLSILIVGCDQLTSQSDSNVAETGLISERNSTPSEVRTYQNHCMLGQAAENPDILCGYEDDNSGISALVNQYLIDYGNNTMWSPSQIAATTIYDDSELSTASASNDMPSILRTDVAFSAKNLNNYISDISDQHFVQILDDGQMIFASESNLIYSIGEAQAFTIADMPSAANAYLAFKLSTPDSDSNICISYGKYGICIQTLVENDTRQSYIYVTYLGSRPSYKKDVNITQNRLPVLLPNHSDEFASIVIEMSNLNTEGDVNRIIYVKINDHPDNKVYFNRIQYQEKDSNYTATPTNYSNIVDLQFTSKIGQHAIKDIVVCEDLCTGEWHMSGYSLKADYQWKFTTTDGEISFSQTPATTAVLDSTRIEKYKLLYGSEPSTSNYSIIFRQLTAIKENYNSEETTVIPYFYLADINTNNTDNMWRPEDNGQQDTSGWQENFTFNGLSTPDTISHAYRCGIILGVQYQDVPIAQSSNDCTDYNEYAYNTAESSAAQNANGPIIIPSFYEYADTLRYGPYHKKGDDDTYNMYDEDVSVEADHVKHTTIAYCKDGTKGSPQGCTIYVNGQSIADDDNTTRSISYILGGLIMDDSPLSFTGNSVSTTSP